MSTNDIRDSLRNLEFPLWSKKALNIIEHNFIVENGSTSKISALTKELISDFVFCGSSKHHRNLSSIEELQLANIIAEYLSGSQNEGARNYVFLSMFGGLGKKGRKRLRVLYMLMSFAMSTCHISTLKVASIWLNQAGCSSPQVQNLTQKLIVDQWLLSTKQPFLKRLPNTVPEFAASLLTAVSELYFNSSMEELKKPPLKLLETIVFWVKSYPDVCLSRLPPNPQIEVGNTSMLAAPSLANLINWCCLAPLYVQCEKNEEPQVKKLKLDPENDKKNLNFSANNSNNSEYMLYNLLHLTILGNLKSFKEVQGSVPIINAQDLFTLVPAIQRHYQLLLKKTGSADCYMNPSLQESLDRIAQVVLIAVTNGRVRGNIQNLLASLHTLPENTLLDIVIRKLQN